MRISDWSSDVCSSDLAPVIAPQPADGAGLFAQLAFGHRDHRHLRNGGMAQQRRLHLGRVDVESAANDLVLEDRKSVVSGKGVSVRVALGGRRSFKQRKKGSVTTHSTECNHRKY